MYSQLAPMDIGFRANPSKGLIFPKTEPVAKNLLWSQKMIISPFSGPFTNFQEYENKSKIGCFNDKINNLFKV